MYDKLNEAVHDLLSELRIDEKALGVMANGYSPDLPGAVDMVEGQKWVNTFCKVQLSMAVAEKLLLAITPIKPEER